MNDESMTTIDLENAAQIDGGMVPIECLYGVAGAALIGAGFGGPFGAVAGALVGILAKDAYC